MTTAYITLLRLTFLLALISKTQAYGSICAKCQCQAYGTVVNCANLGLDEVPVVKAEDVWILPKVEIFNLNWNQLSFIPSAYWEQFNKLIVISARQSNCIKTVPPPNVVFHGVLCQVCSNYLRGLKMNTVKPLRSYKTIR